MSKMWCIDETGHWSETDYIFPETNDWKDELSANGFGRSPISSIVEEFDDIGFRIYGGERRFLVEIQFGDTFEYVICTCLPALLEFIHKYSACGTLGLLSNLQTVVKGAQDLLLNYTTGIFRHEVQDFEHRKSEEERLADHRRQKAKKAAAQVAAGPKP